MVTGQDIIFFWVARMIMAGFEFKNKKPFSDVYFTGMVRDKLGRKMSKSLGNSPDLLELIDKYGADAVRFGIMISSPAGNDLLFDEASLEQGRNFNNKLWNALKLVKGFEVADIPQPKTCITAAKWFQNKFSQRLTLIDNDFKKYKISDALMNSYKLIWDDFCAWYLEIIKPKFIEGKSQPIDRITLNTTINFFEDILKSPSSFYAIYNRRNLSFAERKTRRKQYFDYKLD